MISWLYISSINNILFVLYETNNNYIKDTVGSIHNLVYSKMIEFVFVLFILGYMLASYSVNNYNRNMIFYGILYGFLKACHDLTYSYQRESKNYNIEKINIITITSVESLMGIFNYNANLLVSSYIIAVGSMLIDTANINCWYKNLRYFNSQNNILISNDLEAPLLENTNTYSHDEPYERRFYFDKYIIINIFSANLGDYIIKSRVKKETIICDIIIFYTSSLSVSIVFIVIYLKKYLKRELFYDLEVYNRREFLMRYFLVSFINTINAISYFIGIVIAPSITYIKAISQSWGLILLECISCHNNITNLNDLNFLGSLVIIYSMIIFYLTCYYQN